MTATPGKFIYIQTGHVFDAYEEDGNVSTHVTKNGTLNQRHNVNTLPRWYVYSWRPGSPVELQQGRVARYDVDTEEKAAPIRERIDQLQKEIGAAIAELNALYDYQAGPKPESNPELAED